MEWLGSVDGRIRFHIYLILLLRKENLHKEKDPDTGKGLLQDLDKDEEWEDQNLCQCLPNIPNHSRSIQIGLGHEGRKEGGYVQEIKDKYKK